MQFLTILFLLAASLLCFHKYAAANALYPTSIEVDSILNTSETTTLNQTINWTLNDNYIQAKESRADTSESNKSLSVGAIVGIVIGTMVGFCIFCCFCMFCLKGLCSN
ncbi:hypothetical protein I4U23_010953 [Adineta vaga]|nr:hypothetical protein I4U23_010953 [Adineta vaga]